MNGPIKLECYITLGCKVLPGDKHYSLLGPFVSYEENRTPCSVFRTLHFLRNFPVSSINSVLQYRRTEKLDRDKHCSLLEAFVSYEEDLVLWIWARYLELSKGVKIRLIVMPFRSLTIELGSLRNYYAGKNFLKLNRCGIMRSIKN